MDGIQSSSKDLVKNITNPGSATQLRRLNIPRSPIQRRGVGRGELGDDLEKRRVLVHYILTVGVEQGLKLGRHYVGSSFQLRQAVSYVMHQETVQCLGKIWSSVTCGQGWIFSLKEGRFVLDSVLYILVIYYILLGSVYNSNNSKLYGDYSSAQNINRISSQTLNIINRLTIH